MGSGKTMRIQVASYSPALLAEIAKFRATAFERRRRDPAHQEAWSSDPWDRVSLHVTARSPRREIVGSVRVVCGDRWPLEDYCPFDYDHAAGVELGRLALAQKYLEERRLLFDLIRAAARYCKGMGKSCFYAAVIAPFCRALARGKAPFVTLSPRLATYGEESYLIRFDIDAVLGFVGNPAGAPALAERTGKRSPARRPRAGHAGLPPPDPEELAFAPAREQARWIRTGAVSPSELVALYLERIERLDPALHTYVTVVAEPALERAREAEGRRRKRQDLPPFLGVPISIKDMSETAGIRTTLSSRAFAHYVPKADTSTVRRLKEAGFILLGKTNTPELGNLPVTESELNGICRNPWDPQRTPGGSSGGAAAALAAGLCPISHGSDGAGSIRIPAACCGVFGLKPGRGRVSSGQRGGLGDMLTDGALARTVEDAAALLDVMAGREPGDALWLPPPERPFVEEVRVDPGRLRIGFTVSPPIECPVDPACVAATHDAAALLEALGHTVEEASPDWRDDRLIANFLLLRQTTPLVYGDPDPALLEPLTAEFARRARETSSAELVHAMLALRSLGRRLLDFWLRYDLLLTPTLASPPVEVGWLCEEPDLLARFRRAASFAPFPSLANLTGQPAVSLPLFWSAAGIPIGVQLIGRLAGEAELLRVSAQLEAARPWAQRRPPVRAQSGGR